MSHKQPHLDIDTDTLVNVQVAQVIVCLPWSDAIKPLIATSSMNSSSSLPGLQTLEGRYGQLDCATQARTRNL